MKIAVTYDNGNVFEHFGHTEKFKIYDIENGVIKTSAVISAAGSGHGALAGFLAGHGVDVLICGGIGGGAINALADADIKVYAGVTGNADNAVEAFIAGKLNYDPDAKCSKHEHMNDDCGSHSCGHTCHNDK